MAERFGKPPSDPNPPAATPVARHPDADADGDEPDPAPASTRTAGGAIPVGGGPGTERIDSQVQKAQEQLLNLRRQQEQIERQKRELEELSRRQEELEQGRTELVEKLTRALVIAERQATEAHKRVEQLQGTSNAFQSHLRSLEAINPKSWASADLQRELNRALGMVDHARNDYNLQKGRLAAVGEDAREPEASSGGRYDEIFGGGENDRDFLYFLKAGFAFTLPLVLVLLIVAFLLCWKLVSGSV